jgi:hypothetical protein
MAGLQNTRRKGLPTYDEAMAIVKASRPQISMAVPDPDAAKKYDRGTAGAINFGQTYEDLPYPEKMSRRLSSASKTVFENKDLSRYIKDDPAVVYGTTNIGANPGAYIDPQGAMLVERNGKQDVTTAFGKQINEAAHYSPNSKGTGMITVHQPAIEQTSAENMTRMLAHENIHRNQDRWDMVYPKDNRTPGTSLGNIAKRVKQLRKTELRDRLDQALWNERGILPGVEKGYGDFYYGPSEPVAYMGEEEAMQPVGQLPVRDAMKKHRLENVYDLMTVRGPVASSYRPNWRERVSDWVAGLKDAR